MMRNMDLTEYPAARSGPAPDTEEAFAQVMAEVTGQDTVSVDSDFFADLGANSLVMAQFCARVRKRADLPSVSIKDIYRNPTIARLVSALAETEEVPAEEPDPAPAEPPRRASRLEYFGCGILQATIFLAYSFLVAQVLGAGTDWILAGTGLLGYYLRAVGFGAVVLIILCTLPIALKWILVGRWKPAEIRVWTLGYVRFWVVKTLVQRNLLVPLFVGSPLYSLYLRALGANIGKGVTIFSRFVPVCTDLLTIGEGTVVCKDTYFTTYRAQHGLIRTGPVVLGAHSYVGEMSVLDIETRIGDNAQLGHSSSLHAGQAVPRGQSWHGVPAVPADVHYRRVEPRACGTVRRAFFAVRQTLTAVFFLAPLVLGLVAFVLTTLPNLSPAMGLGSAVLDFTSPQFYGKALVLSFVLYFGLRLAGLLIVTLVPRLLNLALKPGEVYRLYTLRYTAHRAIRALTNLRFFKTLLGDSSAIVHYLRALGCKVSKKEQTGSNFGLEEKYENPYLFEAGAGTMVADGLSVVNAEYTSTSFRLSRVRVGARNFLGNHVVYPAGARTGDNCLLATKVLVPLDGPVREGVGLLGSPSFEIPRSVERDSQFDHPKTPEEFRRRLAAKTRHNAGGMLLYCLAQWLFFYGMLLLTWASDVYYDLIGPPLFAVDTVVFLLYGIGYFVALERITVLVRPLRPVSCSIYDRRFWRQERFWKAAATNAHLQALNGTPFKSVLWRMLGIKVGKRLFDDGAGIIEKTLVRIGDDVTLNAGSVVQCHSQEDGGFKMDRICLGSGCTVGVGALVHYGVTMGEGSTLAPDSFLMKGTEVPDGAHWGGNPAHEIRAGRRQLAGKS
ncbi:non-ribosomal peptide synthetase-like protein [Amycolatopsis echigonensis]|uniref:Non-ribosomal peptide synthetase-like protein n=2 Tax=Amycolatopsis echigonensis TaxID=2576905 RepID=A0A2N3WR59_9PSEU|nr:non-ribosomal peptide synthetase-like protein [Amycolatopsis niigatensis]